jgi:hypothetical protein
VTRSEFITDHGDFNGAHFDLDVPDFVFISG